MIGLKEISTNVFLVYTATVNNVVLNLVLGMHGVWCHSTINGDEGVASTAVMMRLRLTKKQKKKTMVMTMSIISSLCM